MWGERKRKKCVFKRVERGRKRDIGTSKQDICSKENLILNRKSLTCHVEMLSGLSLLQGSVHLVMQLDEYLSTPFPFPFPFSFLSPFLSLSLSLSHSSLTPILTHALTFWPFLLVLRGPYVMLGSTLGWLCKTNTLPKCHLFKLCFCLCRAYPAGSNILLGHLKDGKRTCSWMPMSSFHQKSRRRLPEESR